MDSCFRRNDIVASSCRRRLNNLLQIGAHDTRPKRTHQINPSTSPSAALRASAYSGQALRRNAKRTIQRSQSGAKYRTLPSRDRFRAR